MLESKYNSKDVEAKISEFWDNRKDFKAEDLSTKPPFSVILPPPNVTGFLHIGHALDHTVQDVLIRWHRMRGFNTLWLPGTDHAGIATQSVVEKKLKKDGKSRHDLGREKFLEEVWSWKEEYGNRIVSQMKSLGDSCDWDRLTFTLDDNVSNAVRKVFVSLYKKGLIYKGKRLVNWSSKLQTAISDIEVEYKDVKGSLWHLKYEVVGEDGKFLIAATTRPETFLGDTAICVHPEDERYKNLIGKKVKLPLTGREINIIADEYVDKDFGTGVVKITPAHDFNDYEMGLRHNLEQINLLNTDGSLNENAGEYKGLHVQEARKKIVSDLEEGGFIDKIEPHKQSVGHCERSGVVIEPYLSEQWFMKMESLAEPAKRAVESGTTDFIPEKWTKTYLHWMNNIQDWCISRQLWWGHRIPVFTCQDCGEHIVEMDDPADCIKCGSKNLKQDEDVLDTWFSSALWPFSTMGWPEKTETLKTFYPTSVLVTGPDIIFFWVARMMMQGLEYMKDVPFRKVYLHGLVRDSQGRKMSKSLGNSIDPVELINDYGADALRFTLMAQLASGRDLKFSTQRLEGYRNFINKIWNATRFCLSLTQEYSFKYNENFKTDLKNDLSAFDYWILKKLEITISDVHEKLEQMRFSEAAQSLYSFVWNEFCDWFLEFSKLRVYGESEEDRAAALHVLHFTLDKAVKMLHPFTPFVTEEIYSHLPAKNSESMALSQYPTLGDLEGLNLEETGDYFNDVELIKALLTAVRNIRGENRIKVSQALKVFFVPKDEKSQKAVQRHKALLVKMGLLSEVSFEEPQTFAKSAVAPVKVEGRAVDVIVPLEGLVDLDEEVQRIEKVITKIETDMNILNKKLNNEKYVANAPEDLVEADKVLLTDLSSKLDFMKLHLNRLSMNE